jgi:hypothetical protein
MCLCEGFVHTKIHFELRNDKSLFVFEWKYWQDSKIHFRLSSNTALFLVLKHLALWRVSVVLWVVSCSGATLKKYIFPFLFFLHTSNIPYIIWWLKFIIYLLSTEQISASHDQEISLSLPPSLRIFLAPVQNTRWLFPWGGGGGGGEVAATYRLPLVFFQCRTYKAVEPYLHFPVFSYCLVRKSWNDFIFCINFIYQISYWEVETLEHFDGTLSDFLW